ncbi:transcriptional regulator [Candidatus Aerophobetes bacterium Ae_b3a]|nr:MAG: transcriptional regulator [Candidatus Aerophobetes bacterium Ae_b3a]
MRVPLLDLKAQHKIVGKEISSAIEEVLESGCYILGPNVKRLEEEIAAYCRVKYAIGVASGTDALKLSLISMGIGKGDEVIVPPFTFISTVGVITQIGASPVFIDIEEETFNIDAEKIEEAITEKTKAIIPVHLYGHAAQMEKIISLAKKYNLKVIEDAAQALGTECLFSGVFSKVGSLGDVGCLSFYPTKVLGACGDGGMVLTNNEEIAEKMGFLRAHGLDGDYSYCLSGYNSRLDELQGAILRVKLKYLDDWTNMRRQKVHVYNELLTSFSSSGLKIPQEASYTRHNYGVYTIRSLQRDHLKEYLTRRGIGTKVYYPLPLHLEEIYKGLGYKKGDFPVAEKASREVLSLPIYPELSQDDIKLVTEEIGKFVNSEW